MATTTSANDPAREHTEQRHPYPTLVIANDPVPPYIAPNGAMRVPSTRIPLENIVWDYLRHRAEVAEYVQAAAALEEQIEQELAAQPGLAALREQIQARWAARPQSTNASAGR